MTKLKISLLMKEASTLKREQKNYERGFTEKNPKRTKYIRARLKRISVLILKIRPTKVGYNRIKSNEE